MSEVNWKGGLISGGELAALLSRVRLLDARSGAPGREAFRQGHLRGAIHADLDRELSADASQPAEGGRHPLPALQAWANQLGQWGIGPETTVVAYDNKGGANAASRLWWMLRAVGHQKVAVLDGGLSAAVEAGLEMTTDVVPPAGLPPYPLTDWQWPTVSWSEVHERRQDPGWRVLDVRSTERYRGESEPYDPVAGHIPGALNLPFPENLGPDGRFLPAEDLKERYQQLLDGVQPEKLIVHCGSGVTACHTLLALERAGFSGASLYVGSWSEWCRRELPQATK